jgi:hypothetical protein
MVVRDKHDGMERVTFDGLIPFLLFHEAHHLVVELLKCRFLNHN